MPAEAKVQHDIQFDKVIAQFINLRNKIDEIKTAQKNHLTKYQETLEELAGILTDWLDHTGQTSAKTVHGTVYIKSPPFASLSDPDAFMNFVAKTGQFELMDRKANAPACLEYAEENGALPPGVKINVKRTVGVRKS